MASTSVKYQSRKRPITYTRVFIVLSSLVFTLAICAGVLMFLEGQPITVGTPVVLSAESGTINFSRLIRLPLSLKPNHWKYIVIYQSGGNSGDATDLAHGRLSEGSSASGTGNLRGVAANFHFVIDNGRNQSGNRNGFVEPGASWLEQDFSAPYCQWPDSRYHTFTVYKNAIGICMIGNVNVKPFTQSQMNSLENLVSSLQRKFNVPSSSVKFQWEISGNPTQPEISLSNKLHRWLKR